MEEHNMSLSSMSFRRLRGRGDTLAVTGLITFSGCERGTGPSLVAPERNRDFEAGCNPQPDPPPEMLAFSIDDPDLLAAVRPWEGSFSTRDGWWRGRLVVTQVLPAIREGVILRLFQQWEFLSADTTLPAVLPAACVEGILNLSSGRLVLNESQGTLGAVHVQGWLGGGVLGGELLFNPEPDPPQDGF
jgi:hypothetical protein